MQDFESETASAASSEPEISDERRFVVSASRSLSALATLSILAKLPPPNVCTALSATSLESAGIPLADSLHR